MPEGNRAFFLTVKATTAKNTIKEKQRQGVDWKKMSAIYLPDKGLVSRIWREHLQLNSKESNNLIFKIGKGLEQTRHKRRYECTVEMRYHYTPMRTAKSKNSANTKCWK